MNSAPVDVLVIGGGIQGACAARDAVRRGLSVILVEQGDLASGTSSRSSKLIHGGLRYLETGQFGLVREALAERAILLATAPHLVRPLPFLLPFYRDGGRPAWQVRLGLSLYDALAGKTGLPKHRILPPAEALVLEPALPQEGLRGAALFHDAQMDDARLVVANAVDAARAGAVVRTRTRVTALEALGPSGSGWRALIGSGASARAGSGRGLSGRAESDAIEARAVVNATGAWADGLRALAGLSRGPSLRPTRGAHVVVPALTRRHALLLFARQDRRVFFVLPWGEWSLVGTTDTDHAGAPDGVTPTREDVRYLWEEIAARWSDRRAGLPSDTSRVIAGLRSLVRAGASLPWHNTREARLLEERGVFTLIGGKYTTARRFAERTVDRIVTVLGRTAGSCITARESLPGGDERERAIVERAAGAAPAEAFGVRQAEVEYAMEHEFACSVSDVLWRRTSLWLDRRTALAAADPIAGWMAAKLGWSAEERERQVQEVRAECAAEDRLLAGAHPGHA